jgi:hypothetical protein
MGRFLRLYLVIVFLILRVTYVHCQGQVSISGIKGEFKFDGLLDDACWQNIEPLNMVMHTPTFGNQPTEKSEIMLCSIIITSMLVQGYTIVTRLKC